MRLVCTFSIHTKSNQIYMIYIIALKFHYFYEGNVQLCLDLNEEKKT
jgi:hypothetical protein